jgi:hypothetical protein
MVTTISGTTVTFTDGSTWGGANGALTPDGNTARNSQSYDIGHLILANTIFTPNNTGFQIGGDQIFALNMTNQGYYTGRYAPAGVYTIGPSVNTSFAADHPRHGSQSYYALSGAYGGNNVSGTWRTRGMACGTGINQTNGYFLLWERVA